MVKSVENNFAYAKQLVGKPHTCLEIVSHVLHVPLPSEYLSDLKSAMLTILRDELKIYHPELKGIPVAFNEKSARLSERYGTIIAAQSYIHCDILCEFVVFRPKVGDILKGTVNKCKDNQITCVIHGCFFGTIHKEKHQHQHVKVGDNIEVQVTRLEEGSEGVLSILCSLANDSGVAKKTQPGDASRHVDDAIDEVLTSFAGDSGIENADADGDFSVTCSNGLDETQIPRVQLPQPLFSDTGGQSDSLLSPLKKKGSKSHVKHPSQYSTEETSMVPLDASTTISCGGEVSESLLQPEPPPKKKQKKKKDKKKGKKHKKKGEKPSDEDTPTFSDSAQNLSTLGHTLLLSETETLPSDDIPKLFRSSKETAKSLLLVDAFTNGGFDQKRERRAQASNKKAEKAQSSSGPATPGTSRKRSSSKKSTASKKADQAKMSTDTDIKSPALSRLDQLPPTQTTPLKQQKRENTKSLVANETGTTPNDFQTHALSTECSISATIAQDPPHFEQATLGTARKRKAPNSKSPASKKARAINKNGKRDAKSPPEISPSKYIQYTPAEMSKSLVSLEDWLSTARKSTACVEEVALPTNLKALTWISADSAVETKEKPAVSDAVVSKDMDFVSSLQSHSHKSKKRKKEKRKKKDKSERNGKKASTGAEVSFSSPPKKRIKPEIASGAFPPLREVASTNALNTLNRTHSGAMEEHQRQALYHLQQLGISLPLNLLANSSNTLLQAPLGPDTTTLMSPIPVPNGIPVNTTAASSTAWHPGQTSTPFLTVATASTNSRTLFSYEKAQMETKVQESLKKGKKQKLKNNSSAAIPTLVSDSGFGNGSAQMSNTPSKALVLAGSTLASPSGGLSVTKSKHKKKKKDKKKKKKKERKEKKKNKEMTKT